MDANIQFSSRAAGKVRELIDDEGNPALKLRVFITGGGCSGFSYGFTFDDDTAEDDAVIERDGVTALVDSLSYQYLVGAQIDYREDLAGAQFVVANPNASATCGCGNSFAI
jgi:iron-sulfur cluster insertion protein